MENIFKNRLVSKDFYKIYETLEKKDRSKFAHAVRELFDKKIISDGQYKQFNITKQDLLEIRNTINAERKII